MKEALKIPRKLARKLAKAAAAVGQPFGKFIERALVLAIKERDPKLYRAWVTWEVKAARVRWTLIVDGIDELPKEN